MLKSSAVDKVSCSRTQHIDTAGSESQTSNPSIPSLMLYQLSHCAWVHNTFTSGGRQSKTPILSTKVDKKSLEIDFSIVICRPTGNK